jgi:short-subunit dehydrogenase
MQKVVLVTGASTGIGLDCVRILIENNFLVVATVRKDSDKENLMSLFGSKVKVLILDVSQLDEVDKLPMRLKNDFQITELYGLINNAGVAQPGAFAVQDFSEIQYTFNVNVLGLMKVTQVLLPMLGLNSGPKGRIVNISSVSGKFSTPFLGVYAASKHAVEGFSNALRKEMLLSGIKVSIVGPGSIKTPIWDKGFEASKSRHENTIYATPFNIFLKIATKQVERALPVSAVSECLLHAMTADEPKIRYNPIPNKLTNWYLPSLLPVKFFDSLTAKTLKLIPR